MRIGNMHARKAFPSDPYFYGIKRENFVSELTPWNYKEKGICRIGSSNPLYVYMFRAKLRAKKNDGRLCYCVRVFGGGELNSDFTSIMPALEYANCQTDSGLARSTRLATEDEYPPDMPGSIGSYVVGGTLLKHVVTKRYIPEIRSLEIDEPKKRPCQLCGSFNVIPICYGYPMDDAMEKERRGEIELAGCIIDADAPNWRCKACGMGF